MFLTLFLFWNWFVFHWILPVKYFVVYYMFLVQISIVVYIFIPQYLFDIIYVKLSTFVVYAFKFATDTDFNKFSNVSCKLHLLLLYI